MEEPAESGRHESGYRAPYAARRESSRTVQAPGEGDSSSITGLILAGGRSRRFGVDKAVYPVDGRSMVERIMPGLQAVCETVLIASGADPQRRSLFQFEGVKCVVDEHADGGPMAGILAGMRSASTPWLLVVPCDMPGLAQDAIRRIVRMRSSHVQAVIAEDESGRIVPVCGCYRTGLRAQFGRSLDTDRLALTPFVRGLEIKTVSLRPGEARNVNEPSDLPTADGE